jgi:hypothetical protein
MSLSPNETFTTIATYMGDIHTSMFTEHESTDMPSPVSSQPMSAPVSSRKLHSKNKSVERRNSEFEEGRRFENTTRRGGSTMAVEVYDFQEAIVGTRRGDRKVNEEQDRGGRIRSFR